MLEIEDYNNISIIIAALLGYVLGRYYDGLFDLKKKIDRSKNLQQAKKHFLILFVFGILCILLGRFQGSEAVILAMLGGGIGAILTIVFQLKRHRTEIFN